MNDLTRKVEDKDKAKSSVYRDRQLDEQDTVPFDVVKELEFFCLSWLTHNKTQQVRDK